MNVNGASFQLFLGQQDWGRCSDTDQPQAVPLSAYWDARAGESAGASRPLPAWDDECKVLTLRPRRLALPATVGESALTIDGRRSAAADRYGNVYRIADDRLSLRVASVGDGSDSVFWPDPSGEPMHAGGDFRAAAEASPHELVRYLALTVTTDDYLVVAFARGSARGFQSFDLVAGGAPQESSWPTAEPPEIFALCPRSGGGVWALDRVNRTLWQLDRALRVLPASSAASRSPVPEEPDAFQPVTGPARAHRAPVAPGGIDLTEDPWRVMDPIALVAAPSGALLMLDREGLMGAARVLRLRCADGTWRIDAVESLEGLPAPAHDLLVATAPRFGLPGGEPQLFVTTTIGNQAHAYVLTDTVELFEVRPAFELYPLRRYAGRALLAVKQQGAYDSGTVAPTFVGIVQQPRPSFERFAEFVTPVLDSHALGTVWDKVLIDGSIPAGTSVEIASRASDELLTSGDPAVVWTPQVIGAWFDEPLPHLRGTGSELTWLRNQAATPTRRELGSGSWELLLQQAEGRYLQLRIRLSSQNGTVSPRLRAMRVWSPRFSWAKRFLPAVYREDAGNGRFLERWLANFESTFTQIEDRMVNVRALFDARTVPNDALPWLAAWFDVALDPSWDERRQRLFVRRAMDFFRWRGTVHGVRLVLELAFNACIDEALFDGPSAKDSGPRSIRIVESFQTRLIGALAAGDPSSAAVVGPREVSLGAAWSPEEGNDGLVARYARIQGRVAGPQEQVTPFSLVPPSDALALTQWRDFCTASFGFVPSVGAAERARWQRFLAVRRGPIAALNTRHETRYASFADVSLPQDEPTNAARADDWREFCALPGADRTRRQWQDFLARRYRRVAQLRRAHGANWSGFETVALPDALPHTNAAQRDWLQFEGQLLPMHATAHRFTVLLPVDNVSVDAAQQETRLRLARRLVELEKPAHTVFDVRFFWAFNRVGEARLEFDTQLGDGSRASELIPDAVVGRAYLGASFVAGRRRPTDGDRLLVEC